MSRGDAGHDFASVEGSSLQDAVEDALCAEVLLVADAEAERQIAFLRRKEPREEWMPVHYGYEVQIDNEPEKSNEDDRHITGTLYSLSTPLAKTGKPGPEWNTMEITLDGPRTIVVLNGTKVTDFKEGDPVPERKFDFEPHRGPRPLEGWFGLQNHSKDDIVFFKELAITKLK